MRLLDSSFIVGVSTLHRTILDPDLYPAFQNESRGVLSLLYAASLEA
jgi:hypothetical protein